MREVVSMARAVLTSAAWLVLPVLVSPAGEIELATDAPKPLTPEEFVARSQLAPGFRMELVAAEPHLADPVAIAFDARGRIFVCEIHGYNLEGYLDILELNKSGTLDKAVRRIPATQEALKEAEKEQYGTVKLLEDTDGDGRVDRSVVWADRLPACYGVVEARDGVIVLCAPDIVYLADRDGDGEADTKETLYTGFGIYDMWSRVSNPRWGPDNWIYAAGAIQSGGTIRGPHLPDDVRLGATSFRFRADGSAIEPTSGSASGFGLAMNDWGDRFLVTNQQHALQVAPLPHRYLARNPFYAAPNPVVNISTYGHPAHVYPTSQPHPWRLARSKDPQWMKFYGVVEATANGYFTAASGQAIYRADRFPPEFHGNHFSVDNAQNLIHRCLLEPNGCMYAARRPAVDEQTEFLTSTDAWFRPVNLETGPDGALYVVDMYRAIIEDYSAIPRFLQQLYIESLIGGADYGRIWRIVPDGTPGRRVPNLTTATASELIAGLSNANAWRRLTAQRVLVERGDRSFVPAIANLAATGKTAQTRIHAIHTLDGLESLTPEIIERALEDDHFAVRMHALVLAERWLNERPSLASCLYRMPDDDHPRVRLQLALTLGELKTPEAAEALGKLAARYGDDSWMRAAILSSSAESADRLLTTILGADDASGHSRALLNPLGSIVGARHRHEEIGGLLTALSKLNADQDAALLSDCLEGLIEGLGRGKSKMLASADGQKALRVLLINRSAEVRRLALKAAGLVRLQESQEMQAALAAAGKTALDDSRKTEERLAAIALLAGGPYDMVAPVAGELMEPRQPLDLQLAAVEALAAVDDSRVAPLLLDDWQAKTPKLQDAAMDAVFRQQDRLPSLLDAIERSAIPQWSLDSARRERLRESPDKGVRERAKALLVDQSVRKDRKDVISRYVAALAKSRDGKQGKAVFEKQCGKCHRLQDKGYSVGPELSSITRRSDETLVADVLNPSSQITSGFNNYTVVTEAGRIFTGILAAETATSVTLRREESKEDTILRKDIDEMAASSISMMPEDLEKEVSPQDVADLIAYLRVAVGPELPAKVTLFDEDRGFVDQLNQGDGRATIETADRFSGDVALRITPPQRWSLSIPGWEYRVAVDPQPGEFRYLRFAWKSCGGAGVMIELAGGGKWPPAEKPIWRYYSGKNTTGWAACQVSSEAPKEWTTVTCDLWKDFGSFTLTGIAPTAIGGEAIFDRIELLRTLDDDKPNP
ncbi:MAG: c-type cytochrome [Pirellulaceae bacterium]|nr:c-type cytochrome [Pirellulaceae bacterium]